MKISQPHNTGDQHVIKVALPVPLRHSFDYLSSTPLLAGTRVQVPFGNRSLVGVVIPGQPSSGKFKLKPIKVVLDEYPVITGSLLKMVMWAADYYHHPIGEVLYTTLPVKLRSPVAVSEPGKTVFFSRNPEVSTDSAIGQLARAPKQRALFDCIPVNKSLSLQQICEISDSFNRPHPGSLLKALTKRGLLLKTEKSEQLDVGKIVDFSGVLNNQQRAAIEAVDQSRGQFSPYVLHGITGSGKTEVYLHITQHCLSRGKQALVLVPEIALTPQLVNRFSQRLGSQVYVVHSGMTDSQRYRTWWKAFSAEPCVVLGTRSAIFTPLPDPGVIIVDEEHDMSYKQLEGFRYHARDLAIKRGSLDNIPVILGSATPSMESMKNAVSNKYRLLKLEQRAGSARLPGITLVDLKIHPHSDGLTPQLMDALATQLLKKQQTILYINRRGFAPVAQCSACAWKAACSRCDAYLTFHKTSGQFKCHHCGKVVAGLSTCVQCDEPLFYTGTGTQRIESALSKRFPDANICRFDRDNIATLKQLSEALDEINRGRIDIIIGTQLISKGHDFPGVTLVGVINPDQGLYSSDFRAPEYLYQQLVQVAGRAGRSDTPGNVIIQTAHPDHPYLELIQNHQFDRFYELCSAEREGIRLPPFGYIALWRAESTAAGAGLDFLEFARNSGLAIINAQSIDGVQIMDPVTSPMEKLAGRYRAQLLVKSANRKNLHNLIGPWLVQVEDSAQSRKVRWSIDIDPMELF
jgi:primosomal protein N' (replication factor Y)